jgi:hypothetical protein
MAEATVPDGRGYHVTGTIKAVHERGMVEIETDDGRRYVGRDLTRHSAQAREKVRA